MISTVDFSSPRWTQCGSTVLPAPQMQLRIVNGPGNHIRRAIALSPLSNYRKSLLGKKCSEDVATQFRRAQMASTSASKPTDADLVRSAVEKVLAGRPTYNLVDIGINLADSSYDKV